MKTIKFYILCIMISLLAGCNESTLMMKYHFFTKSELEDLYINQDSVMSFQREVAKCETYEQFQEKLNIYIEIDTIMFRSENGDTITCRYDNLMQINDNSDGLAISPDTKSIIGISLSPLDSCFISGAGFTLQKPSEFKEDSLSKRIAFSYHNFTDGYDVYLYKSGVIAPDKTYFIVSRETFILNNMQIDDCLFVKFYDGLSNEQAVIIYSKKYGFLKIKNTQHEITRIL